MYSIKNTDKENYVLLAQQLLTGIKFAHTPNLNSIHLIDCRSKSQTHEFLEESKRNLQSIFCNLYKRNAEVNIEKILKHKTIFHPFLPIEISKEVMCCRCEKEFTVRINQYRVSYLRSGCTKFRKDMPGKRFTDHPSVNHLNLLDFSRKTYDIFPYIIMRMYENFVFSSLLPVYESEIKNSHEKQLLFLLPKLITVLKFLSLECDSKASSEFYSSVVDTILKRKYDDPHLLLKIWKSLRMYDGLIVCAFEKLTAHFPNPSKEKLQWVLIIASYLQIDLYGSWVRGNKLKNFSNCPVTSALLEGKFEYMKMLLDYGFLQNSRPLARYHVFLRHLSRCDAMLCGLPEYSSIGRRPVVRELLMFLIIRYNHREDILAPLLDKCVYLLWTAIPHPIVTKQQLIEENRILFLPYPNNQATIDLKQKMANVINTYDQTIFKVRTVAQPRSLYHLSRCRVRGALTVACNLPYGVTQLPIAKSLREDLNVPEDGEFWLKLTSI